MGRSIPSFRRLIEIERLNWSDFKKELPTRGDMEAFNIIFENATLYTQYLSNANRPIPIEPSMMGPLFHNYKTLLKLTNESKLNEDSILKKVATMERDKPLAKTLFDNTRERWRGLLYSFHRDDRERLLRMFFECCNSLDNGAAKAVMDKDSSISVLFLFNLGLQNQKLIERTRKSSQKDTKTDVSLLDFIN
jgi:hypothetical protein